MTVRIQVLSLKTPVPCTQTPQDPNPKSNIADIVEQNCQKMPNSVKTVARTLWNKKRIKKDCANAVFFLRQTYYVAIHCQTITLLTTSITRFWLLIYSMILGRAESVSLVGCISTRSPPLIFFTAREYIKSTS